jgi:hypothetical protein
MLRIAFVFVSFYLIGSAAAGSCSNNSTSGKMPNGNTKCPQYNSDSCCTSQFTYIKESCTIDDGCKIGQTCFDLINLVQCANECRPDMSLLVDNNSAFRVCAPFYEKLLTNCKDAQICASDSNDGEQNCFEDKSRCSNRWEDESTMFNDVFRRTVVRVEGVDNCFNGALSLAPWSTALVLVLLALAFY